MPQEVETSGWALAPEEIFGRNFYLFGDSFCILCDMNRTLAVLAFLLSNVFLVSSISSQESSSSSSTVLKKIVAQLGEISDGDMDEIKELAKSPRESVQLLVADLHTIPDSPKAAKDEKPATEHTISEIRALRYLTGGLDFCAASRHVWGSSEEEQNRKYWLTFTNKHCLVFFALWPSHGRTYIAPTDAQQKIIAQWRRWYATKSFTFEYKPFTEDTPPEKWSW